MQLCSITSRPSGMKAIYVLWKQQYVLCRKYRSAYERKQLYSSITNVREQFDENDRLRWRLKVTRPNTKDTGMLQPEYHQPLRVPSVAARQVGQ